MRIVILTGAGVSAESGLGTFRDKDGLWTRYDLAEVATPEGFARDPAKVHDFYNARRANAQSATHNAAHAALCRLQASAHDVMLVTQNVDSLHEQAGSRDVVHMHGALSGALCARCGDRWTAPLAMSPTDLCPSCAAPATRPDIVWFGEMPYHMDAIHAALLDADLFVAIGTSGTVYPAAGFVDIADGAGADTLELNLEPSEARSAFADARYGPASEIVPAWVDEIIARG
ncbi:NAD-dependent deacetylase [Cognatiyoonia koreensis]|uniref:NAD-dependent protein deacylase n=1 Tax=Cognatiyoonia koreensis TaxID=364200 RepID=A0A1I0N5Q2_9RHOB|nr:NAD-dependent deacylase [Cognatiyoonia koreensis]SEV95971.1 NAD-dependent deacetylase [Cognatiyoonia koreensis]